MFSYIFEPHDNPVLHGVDVIHTFEQGFSASSLLTFCVGCFSAVGAVLCTAGRLAAPLASTYKMSIVAPNL